MPLTISPSLTQTANGQDLYVPNAGTNASPVIEGPVTVDGNLVLTGNLTNLTGPLNITAGGGVIIDQALLCATVTAVDGYTSKSGPSPGILTAAEFPLGIATIANVGTGFLRATGGIITTPGVGMGTRASPTPTTQSTLTSVFNVVGNKCFLATKSTGGSISDVYTLTVRPDPEVTNVATPVATLYNVIGGIPPPFPPNPPVYNADGSVTVYVGRTVGIEDSTYFWSITWI